MPLHVALEQAKSLVDTYSTDNLIDGPCIRLRFDRLIRRATADDPSGPVTLWTRHGDSLRRSVTNVLHLERKPLRARFRLT